MRPSATHFTPFPLLSCLQAPCPNCGSEVTTYFGDILTVAGNRDKNTIDCPSCKAKVTFDALERQVRCLGLGGIGGCGLGVAGLGQGIAGLGCRVAGLKARGCRGLFVLMLVGCWFGCLGGRGGCQWLEAFLLACLRLFRWGGEGLFGPAWGLSPCNFGLDGLPSTWKDVRLIYFGASKDKCEMERHGASKFGGSFNVQVGIVGCARQVPACPCPSAG
jgi:hypothetical protein